MKNALNILGWVVTLLVFAEYSVMAYVFQLFPEYHIQALPYILLAVSVMTAWILRSRQKTAWGVSCGFAFPGSLLIYHLGMRALYSLGVSQEYAPGWVAALCFTPILFSACIPKAAPQD